MVFLLHSVLRNDDFVEHLNRILPSTDHRPGDTHLDYQHFHIAHCYHGYRSTSSAAVFVLEYPSEEACITHTWVEARISALSICSQVIFGSKEYSQHHRQRHRANFISERHSKRTKRTPTLRDEYLTCNVWLLNTHSKTTCGITSEDIVLFTVTFDAISFDNSPYITE